MGHLIANRVEDATITLVGILALLSILLDWEHGELLIGLLFWLSLLVTYGSRVEIEKGKVVLRWGWPLKFLRVELNPEDIVEIVNLDAAKEVSLLKYWKTSLFFSLLWATVGLVGLIKRPSEAFIWLNWIYWGIAPLVSIAFPPSKKLEASAFVLLLSIAVALWARTLGLESYPLFLLFALVFVVSLYVEPFKESRMAIVTDRGTYIVSSPFEREIEDLIEGLKEVYTGGLGATS